MKKLIGVLVICMFIITSYSQVLCAQSDNTAYDFAIYYKKKGRAVWKPSVNGFKSKYGSSTTVTASDIRNGELSKKVNVNGRKVRKYKAIFVPGGMTYLQCRDLGHEGNKAISKFVKNGGGYIGICAGAELAVSEFWWKDDNDLEIELDTDCTFKVNNEMKNFYNSLILYNGASYGPIEDIKGEEKIIKVKDNNGKEMDMTYYNGSYFKGPGEVILRYGNSTNDAKDKIAGVRFPMGGKGGRVVLIGPHPEVSKGSTVNKWFKSQIRWVLDGYKQQERVQMADKKKTNTRSTSSRGLDINNLLSSLLNR